MKHLKKKISIILFQQKNLNSYYMLYIPSMLCTRLQLPCNTHHCVPYTCLSYNIFTTNVINLSYSAFEIKSFFIKVLLNLENNYFGIKINNLYFSLNSFAHYKFFFIFTQFLNVLKNFYLFTFFKILYYRKKYF